MILTIFGVLIFIVLPLLLIGNKVADNYREKQKRERRYAFEQTPEGRKELAKREAIERRKRYATHLSLVFRRSHSWYSLSNGELEFREIEDKIFIDEAKEKGFKLIKERVGFSFIEDPEFKGDKSISEKELDWMRHRLDVIEMNRRHPDTPEAGGQPDREIPGMYWNQ